jgi:hypothetical protein
MRLPEFVIIGAAKSGTTSLFRWLSEQPEVWCPEVKEPDFFAHDDAWERGLGWYANLFVRAEGHPLTGEASTSYTELRHAATAARRMADTIADARLIYLLRHPLDRLRSHYRHEIQRGRERRSLADAVAVEGNEYVGSSRYFTCLEPYARAFPRGQICVVRFEDLVSAPAPGWAAILAHLGLGDRARPLTVWNVTADKPGYSRTALKLYERGLLRPAKHLPGPVRRLGRALLTRGGSDYKRRLAQSSAEVPDEVERRIWDDIEHLEAWLGVDRPLWPRTGDPARPADRPLPS